MEEWNASTFLILQNRGFPRFSDALPKTVQQFSVKINSLWNVGSGGKDNYFFAKWVWGGQFYNILVTY